jgi:hypothetical protein
MPVFLSEIRAMAVAFASAFDRSNSHCHARPLAVSKNIIERSDGAEGKLGLRRE